MKKYILIMIALISVCFMSSSFADEYVAIKQREFDMGSFHITIPSKFTLEEKGNTETAKWYASENSLVLVRRDETSEELFINNAYNRMNSESVDFALEIGKSFSNKIVITDVVDSELIFYDRTIFGLKFDYAIILNDNNGYMQIGMLHNPGDYSTIVLVTLYSTGDMYSDEYSNIINIMNHAAHASENSSLQKTWKCPKCGSHVSGNYCNNCGTARSNESKNVTGVSEKTTPVPTATPKPTKKSKTTATPKPTKKIKATATPNSKKTSKTTETTKTTKKPKATATPKATNKTNSKYKNFIKYAKELAKEINYNKAAPKSSQTEKVKISKKTYEVHAEFKYAMDVYYEFFEDYCECLNSTDVTALLKVVDMIEKEEKLIKMFESIDDLELTSGDMAYYLEIYGKIIKLLGNQI